MQGQLDWDGVVLPIPEVTWASVLATAERLQGLEINKDFFVTYKDEEGDVVDVRNEIDLEEAISWAKEQQIPCLCLHVPFSSVDSDDESWTEIENSSPRAKQEEPSERRPIVEDHNEDEAADEHAEHFTNEVTKVTLESQDEDHHTAEEEAAIDEEEGAAIDEEAEADDDSPEVVSTPAANSFEDKEVPALVAEVPEAVRCEIQAPAIRQVISLHRVDEDSSGTFGEMKSHPDVVLTPIDEVFQEAADTAANDTQVESEVHQGTLVLGIDEVIQTMCMVNDARVVFEDDDRTFFLKLLSVEENVERFARLFNNPSVKHIVSVVANAEMLHQGSAQKALTTQLIKALYQNPEVLALLNEIPDLEQALLRVLRGLKSNDVQEPAQVPSEDTPAASHDKVKNRHRLVTCDGCRSDDDLLANSLANGCRNEEGEILGIRYKSAVLVDYDLCETCEATGRFDSEAGPFLKILDSANAPELILCVMPGATAGMIDQVENLDWRNPLAREFLEFVRSRQQRSFASARPERTAPPSVAEVPVIAEEAKIETNNSQCKHMLKRFEAPHGSFRCDACGGKAPVRAVLHGCRQCNFDMCESCYSRKGMSLNLPPPPPLPVPVATSPPQAKFVSDVTLADGCAVRPGEYLVKTWRVRNSGQDRWPAGTRIAHVGGDAFGGPVEGVEVPLAAPGEAVNVSVPLVMPMLPGRYTSYWRLMTPHPENTKFGHRFWVTVNVLASAGVPLPPPVTPSSTILRTVPEAQLPGSPAVVVRPQTVAQPTPSGLNQAPQDIPAEYVETICRIFDFGFTDVEKIVQALKDSNGDAAAAIEKLLEA